jgi:hypothetical protein
MKVETKKALFRAARKDGEPRIVDCRIGPYPLNVAHMCNPHVCIKLTTGEYKDLFWFDPYIYKFNEIDFIGLTEAEALIKQHNPTLLTEKEKTMESKQLPPYNVQNIIRSLKAVLDKHNIDFLTEDAYIYCHLCLGFETHNDLGTFRKTYKDDIVTFAMIIKKANVDQYIRDNWLTQQYSRPYVVSIYKIGKEVIPFAQLRLNAIKSKQYQIARMAAQKAIKSPKQSTTHGQEEET